MKKYHDKLKPKRRSSIKIISQATAIDENSKQIEKSIKKMAPSTQMDMRSVKVLVERTKFNVMHLEVNKKNNATKAAAIVIDDVNGASAVVEIKTKSPVQGRGKPKNKTLQKPLTPATPSPIKQIKLTKQNQKQKSPKQTTIDKVFRVRKCYVKIPKDKALIRLQMSQPKEQDNSTSTTPPKKTRGRRKKVEVVVVKSSNKAPVATPLTEIPTAGAADPAAAAPTDAAPAVVAAPAVAPAPAIVAVAPAPAIVATPAAVVPAAPPAAAPAAPPSAAPAAPPAAAPAPTGGTKRKSTDAFGSSPPKRKSKKGNEFFISISSLARTPSPRRKVTNSSSSDESPVKLRKGKKNTNKKTDMTALRKKFGSRFFKSYVKIKRFSETSRVIPEPAPSPPKSPIKKNRKNLSVSFLDTVEIFGESSDGEDWHDYDSKSSRSKRLENGNTEDDFFTDFSTSTPSGGGGGGGNGSGNGDTNKFFKTGGILKRKEKISFSPLKEDENSPRKEQLKRANEIIVRRSLELENADEDDRDMTEGPVGEMKKESSTLSDTGTIEDERQNSPPPSSPPKISKIDSSTPSPLLTNADDLDPESVTNQEQSKENSPNNNSEDKETPAENTNVEDDQEQEESPTTDSKNHDNTEEEEEESFQSALAVPLPSLNESNKPNECAEEISEDAAAAEEEEDETDTNVANAQTDELSQRVLAETDNEDEAPASTEDTLEKQPAETETATELPSNDSDQLEEGISREDITEDEENAVDEKDREDNEEAVDGEEDRQGEEEDQEEEEGQAGEEAQDEGEGEVEAETEEEREAEQEEQSEKERDEDDVDKFVDTTKFVATVLLQDTSEEDRNEADALLNDVCQIAEAENVSQQLSVVENNLTADVDFSSRPDDVNAVDDDDFASVLTHPELEKTLQAAASTSLVPNSQEIVVAAAVASQATMVAPADVEVTEDTFASVVAEVERFTKEVNPEIYSAEVGITGNDVMMDNVQARHSLDDIFDDDVDDDIISSLRMSSGSIDIGHDKSLPIQVIETEVMAIPNEPDLIFDKPIGTTASILGNTQMASTTDSLVGHGHSSTPETNTKLFGRFFQSVKSYVMSPGGDKSSSLQD